MTKPRRFNYVIVALLMTTFAIGLFISTLRLAEARWLAPLLAAQPLISPQATPIPPDPQPLGEPCGAGELFPSWVICLHGTVSFIDEMGTSTVLDGVPITVSYGSDAITGTTFVHPGEVMPTYGLDISSLEPEFLEPVMLTAVISDMIVSRQVQLFPDFRTQNQRFDVQVMAVGGLDEAPIWGEVIDFAGEGAVAGATVVAEYQGQQVTVTSTVQLSDSLPTYAFSQSELYNIGATEGSPITLTAYYQGDADQQVVMVSASSRQINFVTGWKCDGFDPFTGGGGALPKTSGDGGLPDMACFWGYGLVDGVRSAGMSVQIEISGTVYEGQTTLYPGEEEPRYGIGVLDTEHLSGQMITVTGTYSGFSISQVVTVALDANLSQQVDLAVADAGALGEFTRGYDVTALAWHEGYLWAGTSGGVVRWNLADGTNVQFTTENSGLINNYVSAIAADANNSLWFGTWGGVSHYTPGSGWESFTTSDGLISNHVTAIAVGAGAVWIGTPSGVSRYVDWGWRGQSWESFTTTDGLISNDVKAIAVGAGNSVWIGTSSGVSHFTPPNRGGGGEWQNFTTSDGLISNDVTAIAVGADSVWIGTPSGMSCYVDWGSIRWWMSYTTSNGLISNNVKNISVETENSIWITDYNGVSHFIVNTCSSGGWWESFTTNDALAYDSVNAITVGADNSVWVGTQNATVSHYTPTSGWENLTAGLADNHVIAIAVGGDNSLWFGTSGSGVSHYTPSEEWKTFTTSDGLISNNVQAIAVGADNSLWFGTSGGVSHYTPDEGWESFTTIHGLVNNDVQAIGVGADNSLWFGTSGGVSHYTPDSGWESFTTNNGLINNNVQAIAVGADNSLWFGTQGGVSHYTPGEGWESFTTNDGLVSNGVTAIAVGADNSLWFGTFNGVSHYTRDSEWENFTVGDVGGWVYGIAVMADNSLWFATDDLSHYTPGEGWEHFSVNTAPEPYVYAIAGGTDNTLWFGTAGGVTEWAAPIRQSDLSIQLSAPAAILPNRPFTYTLQIANYGELAVERADLTLTLPVSATYLGASLPPSSTAPLSWEVGTLPANSSSMTLVVTATLAADVLPGTSAIASANIGSITPESYLSNNNSQVTTLVRDPYRSDVRVSLSGPPLLITDTLATYHLWVDNSGGLPATATLLTVELPPDLTVQNASPAPTTQAPLRWEMGTLPELSSISTISLTLRVDDGVSADEQLTVSAAITTASPDSEVSNNIATSTIATSLADAETLILVAPNRLAAHYGASPLLSRLYQLAAHSLVDGVVLDVERDADVQAAYGVWDADPGSWQKANAVAESIKALIDDYTIEYPNLQYLVVVGADAIIPFYRVKDQSPTPVWHERQYARHLGRHDRTRAALARNLLLTDDFYADRSPSVPDSDHWDEQELFYVPDFAIGRLVETPDEMMTLIDAFLANDGQLTLDQNTVGSFHPLTNDLGAEQCSSLQNDGMTALCTDSQYYFRQEALNQERGASWSAFHSNHFSQGVLSSHDILNREIGYEQMLLVSIGCHAGLNVADSNSYSSLDLPQAILGRGGTYIASTSYAYASRLSIGYSEALSLELSEQLLDGSTQTLGQALVHAKQAYYASHGSFNYLDEKVLLPMTLYGLPMLQVTSPESLQVREAIAPPAALTSSSSEIGTLTVVTYTLSDADYTRHEIEEGLYYDFETQIIEQEGYPVQPTLLVPLTDDHPSFLRSPTPLPQGEGSPHGVILRSATYTEVLAFDPVIAQSWAIGEKHLLQAEPPAVSEVWDRPIPYSLALFDGLFEREASLNLVLGAYDSEREAQRLYENLTLEVLYSDSDSRTAPIIESVIGHEVEGATHFQVTASDDGQVMEVIAVCDDSVGNWRTVSLNIGATQQWEGTCQSAERFYVQAVDETGNVAVSKWQTAEPAMSVQLANFSATPSATGESILLNWETVTELDNLGFNLYRSLEAEAPPTPENKHLIPSQAPGNGQGSAYQWADNEAQAGITYYYWLEDLATGGDTTRYGPVSATLNVPSAITVRTFQSANPSPLRLLVPLMLTLLAGIWLVVRALALQDQKR